MIATSLLSRTLWSVPLSVIGLILILGVTTYVVATVIYEDLTRPPLPRSWLPAAGMTWSPEGQRWMHASGIPVGFGDDGTYEEAQRLGQTLRDPERGCRLVLVADDPYDWATER